MSVEDTHGGRLRFGHVSLHGVLVITACVHILMLLLTPNKLPKMLLLLTPYKVLKKTENPDTAFQDPLILRNSS